MDMIKSLGIKQNCSCTKTHVCPIEQVVIGEGAISSLTDICAKFDKILLVADGNTYAAAGAATEAALEGKTIARVIFPKELLVPNEAAIKVIEDAIDDGTSLIVGIGSGVINDLCKYTSFNASLPYVIVATAPSMDGYASVGCALILEGLKVTLNARVPYAIVAEVGVLANAPMEMILSGYGDIIGKYSCLSDWKLSRLVNNEYFCEDVWNATYLQVEKTRALAKDILKKDRVAIGELMAALVGVGVLMAYVGNSRPASGSEHHFSHYFEITGIINGKEYLPHGIDVFYSAAETARIREELLAIKELPLVSTYDENKRIKETERIYGKLAKETLALQERVGFYGKIDERLGIYREKWQEIRALLEEAPSFAEMKEMLCEVGMSYDDFIAYYGIERIRDGVAYAKDTKDRYTVLWTYYDIFS